MSDSSQAKTFFDALISSRTPEAARHCYHAYYPARELWPLVSEDVLEASRRHYRSYLEAHFQEPNSDLSDRPFDVRFRYSKLPREMLRTSQNLFQAMEAGIGYEFQGESPALRFVVFCYFEDDAGKCCQPHRVAESGIARAAIIEPAARSFHRMLMEHGEPFYITDLLARRIARCELISFKEQSPDV